MPLVEYRARGEDGRLHTGRTDLTRITSLREELREQGIFLVETRKIGPGRFVRRKVTRRELIFIAYHLQTVVRAGIPLIAGLQDLSEQSPNRYLKSVLDDVVDALGSGSSLSQALGRHPNVFPEEFVQMTMSGEVSGQLDESLDRLVHLLEWQEQLVAQVRQLVAYPIMVLIALAGLLVLLLTFVIPRFGSILDNLDVELPLPTRVLMTMSQFCLDHWPALLGLTIGAVIAGFLLRRSSAVRIAVDRWSLRIPMYGNLRLSLISSQVSHFLGAFIDAGVPIGEGLNMIARLSTNFHARRVLGRIRDRVFEGETLTEAFAESGLFPRLVLRMISIGEESGTLPESLKKAEDYYDREIPRRVKTLMDVAAPTLTVVLAAVLCFVVLAVLLPVYKMYGALT